ncbi:MAG: hypothetical protein NWE76_05420, partial [Candidatus Bathyarchaeota archaeon]|nr:hypothetical protein [Candidatus Bathyarchaeota archaeon]
MVCIEPSGNVVVVVVVMVVVSRKEVFEVFFLLVIFLVVVFPEREAGAGLGKELTFSSSFTKISSSVSV